MNNGEQKRRLLLLTKRVSENAKAAQTSIGTRMIEGELAQHSLTNFDRNIVIEDVSDALWRVRRAMESLERSRDALVDIENILMERDLDES